jgi:hypothetical protein
MGPQTYARYLVDAHRPAQDLANQTGLAQTVFYHPDFAYSHTTLGSKILRDRKTESFVTWLPANYFS